MGYRFYKLSNGTNCSRAIGFERLTVEPGTTAIANQLDAPSNTLDGLFNIGSGHTMIDGTVLPPGTQIQKWNGSEGACDVSTWSGTSWSPNGNVTLNPGEGAFIDNNSGSPFVVTFVGLVRDGGQLVISLEANASSFVSSEVPQAGGVQSTLGYNPEMGDAVWTWSGTDWLIYNYLGDADPVDYPTGWMDQNGNSCPEPVIDVGEGFWIITGSASDETWTRTFSACH